MNKTDLIKEISDRTGVTESATRSVINGMTEVVQEKLLFGLNVKIPGFISFTVTVSPEHTKRSPITLKEITVPKKYRIKTTLPKAFVDKVKAKTVY